MIIVFLISLITCSMDPETALTFTYGHLTKWFLQCIYNNLAVITITLVMPANITTLTLFNTPMNRRKPVQKWA